MNVISANQLQEMMTQKRDLHLLNVLPQDQFRQRHIPGSVNVPLQATPDGKGFAETVAKQVKSKDEPVVVYCANKGCDLSPKAAKQLEAGGFRQVMDFEGGLDEWEKQGKELSRTQAGAHA